MFGCLCLSIGEERERERERERETERERGEGGVDNINIIGKSLHGTRASKRDMPPPPLAILLY
jgi:hypothetical protein